jgi:hypothetical protein
LEISVHVEGEGDEKKARKVVQGVKFKLRLDVRLDRDLSIPVVFRSRRARAS